MLDYSASDIMGGPYLCAMTKDEDMLIYYADAYYADESEDGGLVFPGYNNVDEDGALLDMYGEPISGVVIPLYFVVGDFEKIGHYYDFAKAHFKDDFDRCFSSKSFGDFGKVDHYTGEPLQEGYNRYLFMNTNMEAWREFYEYAETNGKVDSGYFELFNGKYFNGRGYLEDISVKASALSHGEDDKPLRYIEIELFTNGSATGCKTHICPYRAYKNVVINEFGNGEKELVFFYDSLKCIDEAVNVDVDHSSNYTDIDGMLFPKDENLPNAVFLENTANSLRQSVDAYWGYALSNEWDYFITLTTDKMKVDRFDDDAVKALWKCCRQKLQRFDPDVKILLVAERHKNGALHFHGLVATKKPFTLRLHMVKGKQKYSATGAPLFEFPFWNYGMASCAIINTNEYVFKGEQLGAPQDQNGNVLTTSQRRVVAYLSKYMGKEFGQLGYKKKHFYRTRNVVGKQKHVANFEANDWFEQYGIELERLQEGEGENPYRVKIAEGSELYLYKQDKNRMYFRTKIATREDHEVMGVLVLFGGGVEYRKLEDLEKMQSAGEVELVGENCQYKYFKQI